MIATSAQLCLLAAVLWGVLTAAFGLTPPTLRERSLWVAIPAGVPLVGWITYEWGPGPGVACFLFGIILVIRALAITNTPDHGHPPPAGPAAPSE